MPAEAVGVCHTELHYMSGDMTCPLPVVLGHEGVGILEQVGDEDLDISADDVIVVHGAGPRGYPGMPEVSNVPLPAKLLRAGVSDMVRISDGRISGTGFGAVVLHVAPEAAVGGPLGLLRTGDVITLDVPARRLDVQLSEEELAARTPSWERGSGVGDGGWPWLYAEHVLQADEGADLDFLRGARGSAVPRDSH
ncbi:alcohol dehydrogenase catalytic domain-containing protein [Kineococcus sp. T13]|uniref:alcohol dehydrogenase catalytic domain-containing protein n=1 Tax=Kineococcus vitellinus TaxID=2696565 RepID=UPI001411F48E|nr:alcohol dehydrogenase catalytic domain-containing protein [Kineococcus vitellinus]